MVYASWVVKSGAMLVPTFVYAGEWEREMVPASSLFLEKVPQ